MTDDHFDPLFGAAPEEIPLPDAPLVTVLAQVRFPEIVSIQQKSFIGEFQERVRATYPIMRDEQMKTFSVNEQGATVSISGESVWRFIDAQGAWRLTLTSTFITLETRKYVSRADFIERLGAVVDAARDTLRPTHILRIGMRYVDRLQINGGESLGGMLRPEMMGISGAPIGGHIVHAISEVVCRVTEGHMMARWGMFPENGTHDPDSMPPIPHPAWFLDIDTFVEYQSSPKEFDSGMIRTTALALATRAYSFFRWAVTDKFLAAFGGKIS
ncbi:TIGR04255 family protein [Aminobacter sp. LjRoot7]|uniref:TIGR04255 family protein n=1 Tax=Aminobacter sp. LjRoot7 TaxID=3342335 RepID=UPI003ECFB2D0